MSNYSDYKQLADLVSYSFHGIRLNDVEACLLWDMAGGRHRFSIRHAFKFMFAFNVSSIKLSEEKNFIATFMSGYREDHYELFTKVIDGLSVKPLVTPLFEVNNRVTFHPFVFIKVFFDIIRRTSGGNMRLTDRVHLCIEYAYLCNTILELEKINFSHIRKYLCMCHVLGMENLLTQYFRKKGVETFSLQEGIYLVYKKNKVLGSIAYELFETDHLLCWGQYTKDEYSAYGIDPRRISVAGYPKGETIKPQKEGNEFRNCLVLLAGPIFGDVNNKLLKILLGENDHLNITLKPHPANYSEMSAFAAKNCFAITKKGMTVGECFESAKYDFCIAVNTTAYYESWMAGIPCIRYYDDRFDNFYGFEDLFSEKEDFLILLNEYRRKNKSQEDVLQMLKYAIGLGLNNYDSIINSK